MLNLISSPLLNFFVMEIDKVDKERRIVQIRDKAKVHNIAVVDLSGGEGEIRTLEPFYRLHDFQSCALDQLGDFSRSYSVVCCRRSRSTAPLFYHIDFDLSIPF